MGDYEASTEVDADPRAVFDYLSEVSNLPHYFERMTEAEMTGDGNAVRVVAQLDDRAVEGEAWFDVDEAQRTVSWGSEGPNNYRGRLQVTERGQHSIVTATLSTERAEGAEVQQGLEGTLANVRQRLEP